MHLRPRLLFFLVILCSVLSAQRDTLPRFPQDFVGDWAGTLEVMTPAGVAQAVPMELLIQPLTDTSYTYVIIYGEDREAGKRDYFIYRGPDGPHHWVCDEQNQILLDGYYLGGSYQSAFTVMGNYLTSSLEHRGDHLLYTIQMWPERAVRTSGGDSTAAEPVPAVNSFNIRVFQRARLTRKTK